MRVAEETIAAIATPAGRGGIGIVRVSGPAAGAIAQALCGTAPEPRRVQVATFRDADGATIDRGLALYFSAPHSFTGEDVLELHAHGSPIALARLVRRVCALGARPARAGEFSERAFLNGKLDLAQAEAIADLIAARSEAQVRAAVRSLEGGFSRRVRALTTAVVRLRVEVEAAIDFTEDAGEGAERPAVVALFTDAAGQLDALLAAARQGLRLVDGLHVVLAGAPNVGKSSLLNALADTDRAIVTDVPGTTRDVLREAITLDGIEVTLADTAGLRDPADRVEGEGIRRARAELAGADVVVWVVDATAPDAVADRFAGAPAAAARITVVNKIDLVARPPERDGHGNFALSAHTGAGLARLRAELARLARGEGTDGAFSARERHVVALANAREHLVAARGAEARAAPELVAEELRAAQRALGEITGEFGSEDLLGAIFATFCIGK